MNRNGFTILEVTIATGLSVTLITAALVLFGPTLRHFQYSHDGEGSRFKALTALDTIGAEAQSMRALYVDANRCYAVCMSDGAGNRSIYYWSGTSLARKKEATSNPLVCSSGKLMAAELDKPNTSFSTSHELLIMSAAAVGTKTGTYRLSSSFMPLVREREIGLTEDFECNSLSQGWTVTSGANGTWSLVPAVQGFGSYEIAHAVDGAAADTSSIEIAVDMSRFTAAVLKFRYRNVGTIVAGDNFKAEWWDGATWQPVFVDASATSVPASTQVQTELTSYGLSTASKLRFISRLTSLDASWYVDEISVGVP